MQLLGKLGIDLRLLLAQIVNFTLLVLLLQKFLYRPVIKRIENDEKQLSRAREQSKKLQQAKIAFARARKDELRKARRQAKQIIAEAEEVARKIKKHAQARAEQEAESQVAMARSKVGLTEQARQEKLLAKIKKEVQANLLEVFSRMPPLQADQNLSRIFFSDLMGQLEKLPLDQSDKIKNAMADWENKHRFSFLDKAKQEELLQEFLQTRLGPLNFWFVHPLTSRQTEKLRELVKEKIGIDLPLVQKQDPALLAGFRLEIGGFLLESNLWQLIEHAFYSNESSQK